MAADTIFNIIARMKGLSGGDKVLQDSLSALEPGFQRSREQGRGEIEAMLARSGLTHSGVGISTMGNFVNDQAAREAAAQNSVAMNYFDILNANEQARQQREWQNMQRIGGQDFSREMQQREFENYDWVTARNKPKKADSWLSALGGLAGTYLNYRTMGGGGAGQRGTATTTGIHF